METKDKNLQMGGVSFRIVIYSSCFRVLLNG